jgi:hypothetical protein
MSRTHNQLNSTISTTATTTATVANSSTPNTSSVAHSQEAHKQKLYGKVRLRYGLLYEMFEERAFAWQPYILIRRSIYAVVSAVIVTSASEQALGYSFLGLSSLLLHTLVQPYSDPLLNRLEAGSLFLLICVSNMLIAYAPTFSAAVQVALFFMIVPYSLFLFRFVLKEQISKLRNKWQARRKTTSATSPSSSAATATTKTAAASTTIQSPYNKSAVQPYNHTQTDAAATAGVSSEKEALAVVEVEVELQVNPFSRLSVEQQQTLPREARINQVNNNNNNNV